MAVMKSKTFYPDANSTLRVAYGNVKGFYPADGKYYYPFTYLDGVMEKYVPEIMNLTCLKNCVSCTRQKTTDNTVLMEKCRFVL